MNARDYQKFVYGNGVNHSLDPVVSVGSTSSTLDAPSGSAVVTCNSATPGGTRTYGATVYNDGDILFYTDGGFIYDSDDAVMLGGVGGVGDNVKAQSVFVARAPDTLNGAQGLNNEIFWVFSNREGANGIVVSVVDMSRNGGKGEVDAKIGTLVGSNVTGVDDRLTGWCRETLGAETGVGVISHVAGAATDAWLAWQLDAAGSGAWGTGPNLAIVPVTTNIGPTYTMPINAAQLNSCVKFNGDNTKIATIYQTDVGTSGSPKLIASVNIYTFDPVTAILTNFTSSNVAIRDHGIIAPGAVDPPRIKAYDLEWDRSGTSALSYLYVPNFNAGAGTIDINWYTINGANAFGAGGTIATTLYEKTGINKRQILSMVKDPFNDRMFVVSPELISTTTAGVSAYAADYPEYYAGTVLSILDKIDDPNVTTPTWFENYLDISGLPGYSAAFRKGLPNLSSCGIGAFGNTYYVKPCDNFKCYILDTSDDVWEQEMSAGTVDLNAHLTASVLPIICLACPASPLSMKVDTYNGYLLFFCVNADESPCAISRYNPITLSAATLQSITTNAWWGFTNPKAKAFANIAIDPGSSLIGGMDPLMCTHHYALMETNVALQYAIAPVDHSPYPANATIATGAGFNAGEKFTPAATPTGLVVEHSPTVGWGHAKVIAGKHIWDLVIWTPAGGGAGVWVDQGDRCTPVGETNDLIDFQLGDSTGGTMTLYAYTRDTRYDCNWTTGVLSNPQPLTYLASGTPVTVPVKSVAVLNLGAWVKPLEVTSANWAPIDTLCSANSVWTWEYDYAAPQTLQIAGCFECVTAVANMPTWANLCVPLDLVTTYTDCLTCLGPTGCKPLITCCSYDANYGPMEVVGVDSDLSLVSGDVYYEQTTSNKCVTVTDNDPALFMSVRQGNAYRIDETTGICTVVNQGMIPGVSVDLAFDKHGNLIQSDGSSFGWSNPYGSTNYAFIGPATVSTSMDFDILNRLVACEFVGGVTTFNIITIDLAGTITPVTSWIDPTLDLGFADLTVLHTTQHYFIIGGAAGSGGGNSLYEINSTTHLVNTGPFNLTVTLSLNASDFVVGIENKAATPSELSILVNEPTPDPNVNYIKLYTCTLAGVLLSGPLYLINPTTGTTDWTHVTSSGLAYRDICAAWPTPIAHSLVAYGSCALCYAGESDVCCYKLTHCVTSVVSYTETNLSAHVGNVVDDGAGNCYEVEESIVCIAPAPFTVGTSYVNCTDCTGTPCNCYELVDCLTVAATIETDDCLTPTVGAYSGMVVVLSAPSAENFCREVNPIACTGAAVAVSILTNAAQCADCLYYYEITNCDTGAIIYADRDNSPTLAPYLAPAVNAITIAGLGTDCWQVTAEYGPVAFTHPTRVLNVAYANCPTCIGTTCWQLDSCCVPASVGPVIVSNTSGIVVGDVHATQRIEAEVTVATITYYGCWSVIAAGSCTGVIPDSDITIINSSTIGSMIADCSICPTYPEPCPPPCTLLNPCNPLLPDLTVTGAMGTTIGFDVVTFNSPFGGSCYKVCDANLVHGTHWFWGDGSGINFSSGMAITDNSGVSSMTTFNAGPTEYSFQGSCVHSVEADTNFGGVAFTKGDMLFYSDGNHIYDSTHTLMLDNTGAAAGLLGAGSSVVGPGYMGQTSAKQQCLVIPDAQGTKTGDVYNRYYLVYNSVLNGGIYWSRIDMTLGGGRGRVLVANRNTVLVASAGEQMAVTATPADGSEVWYFYYWPIMNNAADLANKELRCIKFDNAAISAPFATNVDASYGGTGVNYMDWHQQYSTIKISPNNKYIALSKYDDNTSGTNPAGEESHMMVWGINMVTGQLDLGSGGGTTALFVWYHSDNSMAPAKEFSEDSKFIYEGVEGNATWMGQSYVNGWDPAIYAIYLEDCYNISPNNNFNQGAIWFGLGGWGTSPYSFVPGTGPSTNLNAPWNLFDVSGFPQGNDQMVYAGASYTNIAPLHFRSMQLGPDGRIYVVAVKGYRPFMGQLPLSWEVGIGNNILAPALFVIENPNSWAVPTGSGISYNPWAPACLGVATWPSCNAFPNVGGGPMYFGYWDLNRPIGNGLPTYLYSHCLCDPVNIVNPVIASTHVDCTDPICAIGPGPGGWEVTECECSGVNCDTTTPWGVKTWSPTCTSGNNECRWIPLANAVNALGGGNQTIEFSYSFMTAGCTYTVNGVTVSTLAPEQGPTTANPNGFVSGAITYPKTYTINFASFRAEVAYSFARIKELLEGMFNTGCGYGGNLTVTFTDLGMESGATNNDLPGAMTPNGPSPPSFTDPVSGTWNMGDIRIGYGPGVDVTPANPNGQRLANLGFAYPPSNSSINQGLWRTNKLISSYIFDSNEDWRTVAQAIAPDNFEMVMTGAHELMHCLGYGHDVLDYGSVCTPLCTCPCYQAQSTCPSIYSGGPCIGLIPNNVALMGQYGTTASWATRFSTTQNLATDPNGIYERAATCGIYGTTDPGYGCLDTQCGCVNISYYSTDVLLNPHVGGVIQWDDGTAAGLRCWEVTSIPVLPPPPPTYLVSVAPITNSGIDCAYCVASNPCWILNRCGCSTPTLPGPAIIYTTTDLTALCANPTGNTVTLAAYPGVCYEVDCVTSPVTCDPSWATQAVVIDTGPHPDCTTCCLPRTCFTLTNCANPADSFITQTNLTMWLGSIITLSAAPVANFIGKCWIPTLCGLCTGSSGSCYSVGNVTKDLDFPNCTACVVPQTCYQLIDCAAVLPNITNVQPTVDLDSAFVNGWVVKIASAPDECWTVDSYTPCVGPLSVETVTSIIASCTLCAGVPPNGGGPTTTPRAWEGACENCLTDPQMMILFDKLAEICEDCNPPIGLTPQELECESSCFGNSNIYAFIDMTSIGGSTNLDKLQTALNLKDNLIVPTYNQIINNNPGYTGKLFILMGWGHDNCSNVNGTGVQLPGAGLSGNGVGEQYLRWLMYPLSGNAGANNAAGPPAFTGTLPLNQRSPFKYTNVSGVVGVGTNCGSYVTATEESMIEQILILPGSYGDDGFTQLNPWVDPAGLEGMSDPYHEFEGGDTDAICIVFQDEVQISYHDAISGCTIVPASVPVNCGSSLQTSFRCGDCGPNILCAPYIEDYHNYVELYQFGWDTSGTALTTPVEASSKALIYAATGIGPNTNPGKQNFLYHLYGAIGQGDNMGLTCHIPCADYVPPPLGYDINIDLVTDVSVPIPYAGSTGGGDPLLTPGYLGASLSHYGIRFSIPDISVTSISPTHLYKALTDNLLGGC